MDKKVYVWENSMGMMFISWIERETSSFYPDEPGGIKAMVNLIGVSADVIRAALKNKNKQKG